MKGWLYILHFIAPLHHARHYTGSTRNLLQRLTAHANGHGSALCRHLHANGLQWELGGLYQGTASAIREQERLIKDQHNGPRYCTLCNDPARTPDMLTGYDVQLLPFKATSLALAKPTKETIALHNATIDLIPGLKQIMKASNDELGFIPIGGPQGFRYHIEHEHVVVATVNGLIAGYTAFTKNTQQRVRIHQCVVQDQHRLKGIARAMIAKIENDHAWQQLVCRVRADLPANAFWTAIGFHKTGQLFHKTSLRLINTYSKEPR